MYGCMIHTFCKDTVNSEIVSAYTLLLLAIPLSLVYCPIKHLFALLVLVLSLLLLLLPHLVHLFLLLLLTLSTIMRRLNVGFEAVAADGLLEHLSMLVPQLVRSSAACRMKWYVVRC